VDIPLVSYFTALAIFSSMIMQHRRKDKRPITNRINSERSFPEICLEVDSEATNALQIADVSAKTKVRSNINTDQENYH
jgi:hypothetical protein